MSKRHRVDQKLETKYKALVELEKGKSNKEVAQSFGIPPNTLSTWKKNKEKVFEAYNKGNAKTKRMKSHSVRTMAPYCFFLIFQNFPIYLSYSNFHPSSLKIRIRETFYYTNLSIIRTKIFPPWDSN